MGKQIRALGLFLTACYLALFVQLNRITVFDANDLKDKPGNTRQAERDFDRPRGSISTADGVVLAESVPDNDDDRFELQRTYPTGPLFGNITGYFNPLSVGKDGLEAEYNDELAGRDRPIRLDTLDDLLDDFFVDKDHIGNMTLTLRNDVQQAAAEALEGRQGSVVVMDPRDGAILAMYSNPNYDPNLLSTQDFAASTREKEAMNALGQDSPLISHAYQDIFAPGSTYKVVTATAGLDSGTVTPESPDYPVIEEVQVRSGARPISNFGGNDCGGTLFAILENSCNTSFAQMGHDLSAEDMTRAARGYGFNQDIPVDLPRPAVSNYPVESAQDPVLRALTAIGQESVAASPLQMALVAAGVANGGEVMTPHVMAQIRDEDEQELKSFEPERWLTATSPTTAAIVRDAMKQVVASGTAERLDDGLEGFEVGGKTGTAQLGTDPPLSHAWIIGFAGPPGEAPTVAVAVMVEGAPGVDSEQTGGRVAAPIANAVLKVALEGGNAGD